MITVCCAVSLFHSLIEQDHQTLETHVHSSGKSVVADFQLIRRLSSAWPVMLRDGLRQITYISFPLATRW